MIDPQTLQVINDHLMGKYTEWDVFLTYAFMVLLIFGMLFVIIKLVMDGTVNKKMTDEEWEEKRERWFRKMNPHLGAMLLGVGIICAIWGVYLILKI